MADVIRNEEGQLMLLTVFLLVIGVITYTTILNNMIFSSNIPSTGLDKSKQEIRDLRILTEAEAIKAAYYANESGTDNVTEVANNFLKHMKSFNETMTNIYSARGTSVEILITNISLNKTTANMTVNKYHVEWKNHTFPIGSLVIPMDDNQTTDQGKLMRAYGLVYRIVNGSAAGVSIPVWTILQNPVNYSYSNFSSIMNTRNASNVSDPSSPKEYSGGPFLIDTSNFTGAQKNLILNESNNLSIIVDELTADFYYDRGVVMEVPPKIAIYPGNDNNNIKVMKKYYDDGGVPYTSFNNSDILNGNLSNFDILTIPHHNMSSEPENVTKAIVQWVANGGVLHTQCEGTDTMDDAVEKWAGSAKPWYGFIGIKRSVKDDDKINLDTMTYIRLIDNSTRFNVSYTFNTSPPVSLAGLADPGAPFSPLTQSHNKSGMLGNHPDGSTTPAFSLRMNASQVNPAANILGIATYANGTAVYIDADKTLDTFKDAQLMYIEAQYENGLVSYLAGHNQSTRAGGERLVFDNFFAASMRLSLVKGITSKKINVTINYFDGNVRYSDNFSINT